MGHFFPTENPDIDGDKYLGKYDTHVYIHNPLINDYPITRDKVDLIICNVDSQELFF